MNHPQYPIHPTFIMSTEKKSTLLKIHSSEITIQPFVEDIPTVIQSLNTFATVCEIPLRTASKIQTIIVELLDTIIMYNSTYGSENIRVEFNLFQLGKLTINISYKGLAFNPFQIADVSLKEQKVGGLGLHLVQRLMDDYTYQRTISGNVVSMSKNQV